jgi:1,2-phenylacetyl-CoA epoxidase catalytic subunit
MTMHSLDEEGRTLLRRIIEQQAWRQVMSLNILGYCLRYVTRIDSKVIVAEELAEALRRFQQVRALYRGLGWTDLERFVREKAEEVRYPASRLEFGICRTLCDRAELVAMRSYRDCAVRDFALIARTSVDTMHRLAPEGDRVFIEYAREHGNRPHAQQLFDRWLAIALTSFGRPGSAGDRRAVELGLRDKHSHELVREFVAEMDPYRRECGLEWPDREALGIELPEGVLASQNA